MLLIEIQIRLSRPCDKTKNARIVVSFKRFARHLLQHCYYEAISENYVILTFFLIVFLLDIVKKYEIDNILKCSILAKTPVLCFLKVYWLILNDIVLYCTFFIVMLCRL